MNARKITQTFEQYFRRVGVPEEILRDQGLNFVWCSGRNPERPGFKLSRYSTVEREALAFEIDHNPPRWLNVARSNNARLTCSKSMSRQSSKSTNLIFIVGVG